MRNGNLFIVDSDRDIRIEIGRWAGDEGCTTRPFANADDFLTELDHLDSGIILIDIESVGRNGFEVIECVARRKLSSPIIAMCSAGDSRLVVEAIRHGAVDFLMKPIIVAELHEAISAAFDLLEVRRGVFDQIEEDRESLARLTGREREVLDGVRLGKTSKEMARALGISSRTVESYRKSLLEKLGVETTAEAVAIAVRYATALVAHESRVAAARGTSRSLIGRDSSSG